MTSESPEPDINHQPETTTNPQFRRINSNQAMLDLRHQLHHQERIIRGLVLERDRMTKELDSRLFLVEAQLRREQKHIEAVLSEKEHLIQFQAMQIHSLKQLLSQVSQVPPTRNHRSSRRILSKRYSVALDEYMKDHCIVSRALPVMVQGEGERETAPRTRCSRTRSLPELRFEDGQVCCHVLNQQQQRMDSGESFASNHGGLKNMLFSDANLDSACKECCRILSQEVIDEISSRRWTSDCDSEHSDSLDSGISSPSIKSRNMHEGFDPSTQDLYPESHNNTTRNQCSENSNFGPGFEPNLDPVHQKPRRSSSIGNFINRTFSSSSSSEKMKDNTTETGARRHSSFSGIEARDPEPSQAPPKTRFISSANRTFGTNHRSVTKPRDIKFRKLFKFRRRTEPEVATGEDYMTV